MSSRSPRDSGVRKTQNKAPLACLTCRKKKVKCSGIVPCEYCQKRGLQCSAPLRQERKVYSVTHVEGLENRLAQYEGRNQDMGEWLPDAADDPSQLESAHHLPRCSTIARHECPCAFTNFETYDWTSDLDTINRPINRNRLVVKLECYLWLQGSKPAQSRPTYTRDPQPTPTTHLSNPNKSSPTQACITHHRSLPLLPSEQEAYRLLEFVSLYIGQSQSHFDVREISDNIELYYADPEGQLGPSTPWILRMTIILAVGKLLSGENTENNGDTYPGSSLFEFVHTRLPTPSEQHAQGRVAIETLTLLGVYLQAMNRKEEAYIYTSIALRLAVTHGYHRPLEGTQIFRSEKAHIGRLWWTIYMQERRLAAATGYPYGIDDAFIVLEYPVDQFGFSSTIFGFFDCDAIFSATFVLILTVVFDSACKDKDKINPSPGLGEALENLQYLSDNHNTTAIERLQEVQDIWCHLPEHFRTNENTVVPSRDRSQTMHDNIRQLAGDSSHGPIVHDCTGPLNNHGVTDDTTQLVMDLGQPRPIPGLSGVEQDSIELRLDAEHDVSNFPNEMSRVWIPSSANIGIVPSDDLIPIDMPMDEYFAHFQSLLDNPDWYLTGRDVGDLAEFGRHIANLSRTE
uniref:Zn(2)-C6 fungal-type domain-containing protein n=1 Tax=Bionectria ochroleuca TaxID=29856 RepID=A0A8H7KAX0_BIOOC